MNKKLRGWIQKNVNERLRIKEKVKEEGSKNTADPERRRRAVMEIEGIE